jgi:hypothetical protein
MGIEEGFLIAKTFLGCRFLEFTKAKGFVL